MDFMGIGPLELILILILAFLFFGPEKLPGMAAKAGRLYRNFRKSASEWGKTISEDLSSETEAKKETKTLAAPKLNGNTDTTSPQTTTTSKPDENLNEE
jgi:sec-independent protein translocase protein TatB